LYVSHSISVGLTALFERNQIDFFVYSSHCYKKRLHRRNVNNTWLGVLKCNWIFYPPLYIDLEVYYYTREPLRANRSAFCSPFQSFHANRSAFLSSLQSFRANRSISVPFSVVIVLCKPFSVPSKAFQSFKVFPHL
jgi:hypothetical protein